MNAFLSLGQCSYGGAATVVAMIYILGLLATPFLYEARGEPLPEAL